MRITVAAATALLLLCAPVMSPGNADSGLDPWDVVSNLRPLQRGPHWVALGWESPFSRHDVLYREARDRGRPLPWKVWPDVLGERYSVTGLTPETRYQFSVRGYPEGAAPVDSAVINVETAAVQGRDMAGVVFWPPHRLETTPPGTVTEAAVEAHGGMLYVVEAHGGGMQLSQVSPEDLAVRWTRSLKLPDGPHGQPRAPDMAVYQDRLWIAWHEEPPDRGGAETSRGYVARYDPAAGDPAGDATPTSGLLAALEIEPSEPGRGLCCLSVAALVDALWVSWVEVWLDGDGQRRGTLHLAAYDPARDRLGRRVEWDDCPAALPGRPSLGRSGGDLVVLFSDARGHELNPGSEALWCARFNGKRFHNIHLVRTLGSNREARGVQYGDRFHFVYPSDANYPAGDGLYHDIVVGRLPSPAATARGLMEEFISALPYVMDMKHNSGPDITVLGDTMYTVHSRRDDARGLVTVAGETRSSGFGTYIGRITRGTERVDAGGW